MFGSTPLWLLLSAISARQITLLTRPRYLLHANFDNDGRRWYLYAGSSNTIGKPILRKAVLLEAGYRTRILIVLVLCDRSGRHIRVPVWCDQISPSGFSYLHQQLAFDPADKHARYSDEHHELHYH